MRIFKNIKTGEEVEEECAEAYALEHLGISIRPVGKHGVYTIEQVDFLQEFTRWYFSGNWIEDREEK